MGWLRTGIAALGLGSIGLFATGAAESQKEADVAAGAQCVKVSKEARFRNYAYDHIVHLDNRCDAAARCEVSTNVNPDVTTVVLDKGEKKSVLTFRGSPAREFQAKVACETVD